jgi:hypothetical protein
VIKYRQQVVHPVYGDCFRACMATLVQLPPAVLPNDHSPHWWFNWWRFLGQFGLSLDGYHDAKTGAIWHEQPWIASVPSLNLDGSTHAILMHEGGKVFHDPSPKKRYRTGTRLGSDVVRQGSHLVVTDVTKLHLLHEYREKVKA